MKRISKILALVLALTMVFCLAACGEAAAPAPAAPAAEPAEEPVVEEPVAEEPAPEPLNYPTKDITMIVPFKAGGGVDLLGRVCQNVMSNALGCNIIVENMAGGSTTLAATTATSAAPDDHTWFFTSEPSVYLGWYASKDSLSYTMDNFIEIGCMTCDPGMIAVAANSPYQTLGDLIEAAKTQELTCALNGVTGVHAAILYGMMDALGITVSPVPYESGPEQDAAMLGGHVDFAVRCGGWEQTHGDTVRVLAVTWGDRMDKLPDVPTFEEETGIALEVAATRGLIVPASTSPEVVSYLREVFDEAMQTEDAIGQVEALGQNYMYANGEDFAKMNDNLYASIDANPDVYLGE